MKRFSQPKRLYLFVLLWNFLILSGDCAITYSGFITDVLCFDKCEVSNGACDKCALDSTNVVTRPSDHTVHCMRDVEVCYESGFVLTQNVGTKDDPTYHVRFKLDSFGNDLALQLLQETDSEVGVAVTITGEESTDGSGIVYVATLEQCIGGGSECDGVCVGCTSEIFFSGVQGPVKHARVVAHGSLLVVAWGFIAPCAFLVKRYPKRLFRGQDLTRKAWRGYPLHFLVHGGMMLTTVTLTIIAVSIALTSFDQRAIYGHMPIGLIVFVVTLWQPIAPLFFRPSHNSPKRKYFNWVHRGGGGFLLGLGVLNIFLGSLNYMTLWDNCTAPAFFSLALIGIVMFYGVGLLVVSRRKEVVASSSTASLKQ